MTFFECLGYLWGDNTLSINQIISETLPEVRGKQPEVRIYACDDDMQYFISISFPTGSQ